jgi:hypothetical protein
MVIESAHYALCLEFQGTSSDHSAFRTARSLATDEAALIVTRLYLSPPASPGWTG